MTQQWIENYWSLDRASLVDCAKRHAALNEFIAERDRLLAGHETNRK